MSSPNLEFKKGESQMRYLKGSRENGMPSRVQLFELFKASGDYKAFHRKELDTIQRADLEETAEKLLRRFKLGKTSRDYFPEDSPFHDLYAPAIHLFPTLANLIAYWVGAGESRKDLLIEDEDILTDWPW